MSDHPGATGFTFSFAGNGKPDFITVIADRNPGSQVFFQLFDKPRKLGF
jgi:hypothetical protein